MRNGGDSMIKTAFYDTKEYDNKYPKFMLCKITPMEENEVLFTNLEESNKNDVNERLKLTSLNWQVIENPVVDYIPAFEIYW